MSTHCKTKASSFEHPERNIRIRAKPAINDYKLMVTLNEGSRYGRKGVICNFLWKKNPKRTSE